MKTVFLLLTESEGKWVLHQQHSQLCYQEIKYKVTFLGTMRTWSWFLGGASEGVLSVKFHTETSNTGTSFLKHLLEFITSIGKMKLWTTAV